MPYLDLKEVAEHLGVSQKTVYRLLNRGELPAVKVGRQWRFYRKEVEAWLKEERPEVYVAEHLHDPTIDDNSEILLSDVLRAGGIFFKITGNSAEEVLKNAVNIIYLGSEVGRQELAKAIITRERLCTTAIGQGTALPHPRRPYRFNFEYSSISLCFLENKIDFGAMDKRPVNKLFFVFGKTEKEHLQLLKILVNMLQQPEFIDVLENPANRLEVFEVIQRLEKRFQLESVLN